MGHASVAAVPDEASLPGPGAPQTQAVRGSQRCAETALGAISDTGVDRVDDNGGLLEYICNLGRPSEAAVPVYMRQLLLSKLSFEPRCIITVTSDVELSVGIDFLHAGQYVGKKVDTVARRDRETADVEE